MTKRLVLAAILLGIAAGLAALTAWQRQRAEQSLLQRLDALTPTARAEAVVPCTAGPDKPLILLVLGQSNAANHGAVRAVAAPGTTVFAGGRCQGAADPLPGATGQGGSIWSRLPEALRRHGMTRQVLIAPLAVDATRIEDWARDGSSLNKRLRELLHSMRVAQLVPDLVLWQQGEADAQRGTSRADYLAGIDALRMLLRNDGVSAPMVLALSTYCRNAQGDAVRNAVQLATEQHADVVLGPDTDQLIGPHRADGCHFSGPGLDAAADEWSVVLSRHLERGSK